MLSAVEAAPVEAPRRTAAPTPAGPRARWAGDGPVLAAVWLLSAALMGWYLRRGWVPHDEGTIAQSAERVLWGELPHRDFVDLYTGGLTWLNALSFRLFGATLASPRFVLLAFALLWVPALYFVARRFGRPVAAGAVTLLAVVWSVPNYMAALPSWYNLFFATFGLAALLRGLGTGRRGWLAAAGLCGGLSVVFKVSGIFFLAAALVAIAYSEQSEAVPRDDEEPSRRTSAYAAFLSLCAVAAVGAAVMLVRSGGPRAGFHFVIPVGALAGVLLWNERASGARASGPRFRALFGRALPFLAGAAVPLAAFGAYFAARGALPQLLHGVFVLPMLRLDSAALPPPAVGVMLVCALVPLAALALPGRVRASAPVLAAAVLLLAAVLYLARGVPPVYAGVFVSARAAIPLAVGAGAVLLARSGGIAARRRVDVFAVLSVAAFCSLVQFPFAAAVYFCYVAPLAVLAVAAALSLRPASRSPLPVVLLCFYLAFGALWVNRGFIFRMGMRYVPDDQTVEIALPRAGGLRVRADDAEMYARVAAELRRHARGPYVYAGADAPEVYFLAGYRNPTPQLFEFFDRAPGYEARLLGALERTGVRAVALNRFPEFTRTLSPALVAEIAARYPHYEPVGKFVVAWREPGDPPRTPAAAPAGAAPAAR